MTAPYTCKFCGLPSHVDPSDQERPVDVCPDSNHEGGYMTTTYLARLNNADGSRSTVYATTFELAKRKLQNRMARMCDRLPEVVAEEVMALAEDINHETHCFSRMVCGRVFEVIAIEGETE
jgi:hypothetical protein